MIRNDLVLAVLSVDRSYRFSRLLMTVFPVSRNITPAQEVGFRFRPGRIDGSCDRLACVALLIALHVLAVVVWVGGMFFAYLVLRPSAGPIPSEARLALWHRVFRRFFPFVWASIVVLLASGYGMMFLSFGGFAGAAPYIHVMQGLGIAMMLLFLHLFFGPWRRFGDAVTSEHFPEAAKRLAQIRRIVATNLGLGLLTIIVGASGRFW